MTGVTANLRVYEEQTVASFTDVTQVRELDCAGRDQQC